MVEVSLPTCNSTCVTVPLSDVRLTDRWPLESNVPPTTNTVALPAVT